MRSALSQPEIRDGEPSQQRGVHGAFTIVTDSDSRSIGLGSRPERFLAMDPYAAATAYVAGEFEVEGDLVEAVRYFGGLDHPKLPALWHSLLAHFGRDAHGLAAQRRDIQFHYDRSNEFYAQFLDSWMQYSSGDYSQPRRSLEDAQREKLEQICRALKLQPGDRLLDVGCGWGGLLAYAAERFGVLGVGCTLSEAQKAFALDLLRRKGLEARVSIELRDYREVTGKFDKIVSVGMFEHVGRRHLSEYFLHIREMLGPDGVFLNRGIVRPGHISDGPETLFLQRYVFPGGELEHLADVVREAENAGFEIEQMSDFRRDYGLTCQAWVERLKANAEACRSLVDVTSYRTWLLYLAASAVSFENRSSGAAQLILRNACGSRPGPQDQNLNRV